MIRNAAAASRLSSSSVGAEAFHHRQVLGRDVGVQLGHRDRGAGRLPEQRERRLGPEHLAGQQVLLPAADPAEPLGLVQQRAEALDLARGPPGDHHAVVEAGDADLQDRGDQPAGHRRGDDLTRGVLRLAGRHHLDGPVVQAAGQGGGRVDLQQRPPGQGRGVPARGVGEVPAEVADPEVGDDPGAVPDRGREQRRAEQAVHQAEGPRRPVIRGQVPAGQPGTEGLGADVGEGADLPPERVREPFQGAGPADLHRPQRRARAGQREHRAGALRPVAHQRRQRGVRPALRPPVLRPLVRRPLRGRVHVRVDAPPAAGVAGGEPGLPGQFQAAVGLGQPQGHGGRARRGQCLLQHGGRDAVAVVRGLRGGPGQGDLVGAGQRVPRRVRAVRPAGPGRGELLPGDLRRELAQARA